MGLVSPFPVSRRSLARKLLRDITGLTGLKRIVGLTLMDLGFLTYSASGAVKRAQKRTFFDRMRFAARRLGPVVLSNLALFAVLYVAGQPLLYLLWVGAYLTVFSLFLRIRSLAEHACTEPSDSPNARDPLLNTRTTRAGILARLTVAPHYVNYHLEHHLLMTVPHHKLPRMHRMLIERGAFGDQASVPSYIDVLRWVGAG
jgi:fatty acid desaturase